MTDMFMRIVSNGLSRKRRQPLPAHVRRGSHQPRHMAAVLVPGSLSPEQAFHLGQFALQFLH